LPCNYRIYPKQWHAFSRDLRADRAHQRCERCGVPNHAVGYRDTDGTFIPACGNGPQDAAGTGKHWPSLTMLTYSEAREFAVENNCCGDSDDEGDHWIVTVLGCAHLCSCDPPCADPSHIAVLCQQCHNRLDARMRSSHGGLTRRRRRGEIPLPFEESATTQ
jgi:hypothetical protein